MVRDTHTLLLDCLLFRSGLLLTCSECICAHTQPHTTYTPKAPSFIHPCMPGHVAVLHQPFPPYSHPHSHLVAHTSPFSGTTHRHILSLSEQLEQVRVDLLHWLINLGKLLSQGPASPVNVASIVAYSTASAMSLTMPQSRQRSQVTVGPGVEN